MAEKSFPFDAVEVEGALDRLYSAGDFARYFAQFIGNGVYPNPSNGLQAAVKNGLVVTVCAGSAFATGYGYMLTENMDVAINAADAAYNRKDIIVARLDLTERKFRIIYRPGTPGANPQPPAVVRNSDIYDLQLAQVTVRAGTQSILPADILDTRMNGGVCGIVAAVVNTVDTTALFNQYQAYLNTKISEWNNTQAQQQAEFDAQMTDIEAWYNSVKVDIALLRSFDFDNLAELKGCTKSTVFNANGSISESIIKTSGGSNVAARNTVFNANGSITETTTVYDENGTTVLKTAVKTTTFNANGSISEVIV